MNRGNRISRQQIDRLMKRVASLANRKLPNPDGRLQLHAHKLRHTSTKRVYQKKGPVEAKKFSRHRGFKQLERYATATKGEHEDMVDSLWD